VAQTVDDGFTQRRFYINQERNSLVTASLNGNFEKNSSFDTGYDATIFFCNS